MTKNMRVLITGGAGYIGSILSMDLLKSNYNVTILDSFIYNQNSLLELCYNNKFNIIKDDVRNKNILKKLVEENDIIVPLAAIVGAPACEKDKNLATEINLTQIENIISYCSNNQKILFPVTNSGYGIGEKDKYCDEDSPLNPISHYGKTKVEAEKIIMNYKNAVAFRLATVFGVSPRMRKDLLVNDFVYKAFKDHKIILFESHFKRNYIHIRDVSGAFLFALENYEKMRGQVYNLGLSNANLSKLELCMKIKNRLKNFDIVESQIGKDPDKRDYIVSNKKIEDVGWKPNFSLEQGIDELIKCYSYLSEGNYSNI